MHLQKLARVATHTPADNLNQVLHGLRWRLGFERLARFALRGGIGGSLALIGLVVAMWFTPLDASWLWLAATPLLAACVYGIVRWPTHREVAIVVDRRFTLDERLATAVELAEARAASRFAALQARDAAARAANLPRTWLVLDRCAHEALLALAALVLAAATLAVVPRLPRPPAAGPSQAETTAEELARPDDDVPQRALPLDAAEQALPTAVPARAAAGSADLASRVQQEQAERSALDKLSRALGNVSAGQPAADAIQRGDFDAARDELQNLADNADQLTDAAKKQLASALQQAAARTTDTDKALADREQQTAQALSRPVYTEQRQSLRALADQVQRSGGRSATADQLERDLGQLQQQTAGSASAASAAQQGDGQSGAATAQSGTSAQSGGAQGVSSASSGQNGDGNGQQNGAGIGTGSDPNLYADQPSRLDTTGQQVQVPLKLGNGPGVRPADGSEDQAAPQPGLGTRSTAEHSQTQQTGQVAPEQNLVPGEQRPVVRGYFR